jgi:hypothetical protein
VEPVAPHLEPGHLAFRPEPVLASTEHPKPGAWLTVEGQNDVHRMLQRPGPGDFTVLRHVASQEDRDAFRLGQPDERLRAAPNLRGSAGHLSTSRVPEALDGIDGEQDRPFRPGRVHERPSSRPEANATRSPAIPSRRARRATWSRDSSPEARRQGSPAADRFATNWRRRVDLPM